jgi:hypothetical protein
MRQGLKVVFLSLLLATPCFGAFQMDSGAQPMMIHLLGAGTLLGILKWQRIAELLREYAGLRREESRGWIFAAIYALVSVPLTFMFFQGQPLPRFNDIFLIGISITAYFFSRRPALFLFGISILATAWILPPFGSLRVAGFSEWYRLVSFTAVAAFLILLLSRGRLRFAKEENSSRIGSAAAGD